MNRRSAGGYGNRGNNNNNRFSDNNNARRSMGGGVPSNNYGGGNGGGWRQGGGNQGRPSQGNQGGMNMNVFDNRPFNQPQQQHQMNQNQFQNQFSNAVLHSSVGSNPGMMSSFGGNRDQPLVMVLPQSQSTGGMMGGNMGMVQHQQTPNPFAAAVMNQQKPMQVIVGNLPGLNPAAFGQQVLPAYGQGVGEQNMGMFGQQTQQGSSNRYGRDNMNSSDRGRSQRYQKVSLVRRTEANDRGRVTATRGVAKKRNLVMRDPFPDTKKARTNQGAATAGRTNNRVGVAGRKDRMKNRRTNKAAANKAKTDDKGKDAAKTDDTKPAENGDVKDADVKTEATEGADTTEGEKEKKPSKYDELPVELLVCKVCQKVMNDGASFESHLTGKAHLTLLKILEQKFTKRAELLMNESKMCEEEIAVEMERQRRAGKGGHGKGSKHHCKMCDCNYTVNWGTHKQSVWHRVLKEFLHPNCRFCKSQFVHRRDWVDHLLSIGHLRKLLELKGEGKISVTDQETTSQEELFAVHIEVTKDEKPLNIVNIHSLGGRQPLTDDIKDMLLGENGEIVLPEGEIPIPDKFDENVAVGEDAILVVGGSCCKVCRTYIKEGEAGTHCKERQHFDSYVEYLKRVVKLREQKAADEKKAQEEAELKAKAEAEAAAKAAEAVKTEASGEKMDVSESGETPASQTETKAAPASPTKDSKPGQATVDKKAGGDTKEATSTPAVNQKPEDLVVLEEADGEEGTEEVKAEDEKMEEDQEEIVKAEGDGAKSAAATPVKAETAKPAVTPKTPQRGGQNNRGARGSPARGRGGPQRGGGGFRGRGGAQQQQQAQTPARNTQPRIDSNIRGGRGGQGRGGRGGARGSPRGGRGRGGW